MELIQVISIPLKYSYFRDNSPSVYYLYGNPSDLFLWLIILIKGYIFMSMLCLGRTKLDWFGFRFGC